MYHVEQQRKIMTTTPNSNTHQADNDETVSNRYCFVHRVSELPLVAFSLQHLFTIYDKTKNYNRLLGASFNLAESGVKLAAATTEPFLKLLDGPIVATSKLACKQLEKLEQSFPVIKTTPEQLLRGGKYYYDKSYLKSGVDSAFAVVLYGENKVRTSKKLAGDVVSGVLYVKQMNFGELVRFGFTVINQTLDYSDNFINFYIAPPNMDPNGSQTENDINSVVTKVVKMSSKVVSGVTYKVINGFMVTKEQAVNAINQMQGSLYLIEYAKSKTIWMTEEAIAQLAKAQHQAAVLLREAKDRTIKYGKQPDLALLNLVQNVSNKLVFLSNYVHKCSAPYLPKRLGDSVTVAVQYARDLNETFNKANSLGELKDEMLIEARRKFAYIQGVFLSVIDYLYIYPPISWMAGRSTAIDGVAPKSEINGEVVDGTASETTGHDKKSQ